MKIEEIVECLDSLILAENGEHLSSIQSIVLRGSWQEQTYAEMAQDSGYSEQYIKEVAAKLWMLLSSVLEKNVTKRNFQTVIEQRCRSYFNHLGEYQRKRTPQQQDWRDAPDVSIFFGRNQELNILTQWITRDHCQLVAILGIGGIGKTSLAVKLGKGDVSRTKLSGKLGQGIQEEFDYVVWRSLLSTPKFEEVLADIIKFLSNQQITELPEPINEQILLLLKYFKQHRCLVILDNAESLLQGGDNLEQYQKGCENYGQLFQKVGEVSHQSCLLLTSREKPPEIASLEGDMRPVRSLQLGGLDELAARQLFKTIGDFSGADEEWKQLLEAYKGNPLALELAARHIQAVFMGDVSEFMKTGKQVFSNLQGLLNWHFDRLSEDEKEIMYWLTINGEPVSVSELQEDIVSLVAKEKVSDTLQLLQQRLPLEKQTVSVYRQQTLYLKGVLEKKEVAAFALQPVLSEYMLERLVREVGVELQTGKIELFNRYALLKAAIKDSLRERQRRLILNPILDRLISNLGSLSSIENRLKKIIERLQKESPRKPGYTAGNVINLLCQIQSEEPKDLSNFNFSNLVIRQAYLQEVQLKNTNFLHSDITKSVFTNTLSSVLSVTLSSDGNTVVTGDSKGNICLWNVKDGQQLLSFRGHDNWVWSVKFSPDGEILASASDDKTVRIWEVKTGKCLKTLKEHNNWVRAVAFSPNGKLFASGSDDTTVRIWDTATSKCIKILTGHTMRVWSIAYSPDSKILATSSDDQTVRIWHVQNGKLLKVLPGHKGRVQAVAFSHDGQTIASGSADATVRLWDVQTWTCLNILDCFDNRIWDVAFSPDDQKLVVASDDETVRIYDSNTLETLKIFQGHDSRIWSVAFGFDKEKLKLATGSDDKTVKIWDVETGQCIQTLRGQTDRVWSIAFSSDGKKLASGSEDRNVRIWDVNPHSSPEKYSCITTIQEHTNWVWSIAFSPDSKTLAIGSDDKIVKIWDIETRKCLKELKGHTNWVLSVAFSADGQLLASGSEDATVKLWDVSAERCLKTFEGHTDRVRSIAFSPNGEILASGSDDKTIKLWNVDDCKCLKTIDEVYGGHTDRVRSVTFSPDGKILASGSDDKTIKLWDIPTYKCLKTFAGDEGHEDRVVSVTFHPNGHILASGSDDKTVRIWDIKKKKFLKAFAKHNKWVRSVAFSPMGNTLASSSQDETIMLWDIETEQCYKILRAPGPYEGMNITGVTGLTEAEKATLIALGATL